MAEDLTRDSDRLLSEGRSLVRDNQEGGRHRREGSTGPRGKPIGRGSAALRRRHLATKLRNILLAAAVIFAGSMTVGLLIDGLGFAGMMITLFLLVAAVFILTRYPKIKVPRRADLNRGDVKQLVSRTELWLEHQRPALPPPAATLVDGIGVQLDALGLQLETVDPAHPAAQETRKLVGEYLPEMIESYRRIPEKLRREERAGATPDQQLVDSLGKISGEIDQVTRQLADGALDDLAIRSRYLDYKFGGQIEGPDTATALPAPGVPAEGSPDRTPAPETR